LSREAANLSQTLANGTDSSQQRNVYKRRRGKPEANGQLELWYQRLTTGYQKQHLAIKAYGTDELRKAYKRSAHSMWMTFEVLKHNLRNMKLRLRPTSQLLSSTTRNSRKLPPPVLPAKNNFAKHHTFSTHPCRTPSWSKEPV
jgi:hypothetical protein